MSFDYLDRYLKIKILLKIYLHYYFCSSVSLILTGYLYNLLYILNYPLLKLV